MQRLTETISQNAHDHRWTKKTHQSSAGQQRSFQENLQYCANQFFRYLHSNTQTPVQQNCTYFQNKLSCKELPLQSLKDIFGPPVSFHI